MNDAYRVSLIRNFLNGITERRDVANEAGEPFAIDGESTIAFLTAVLEGRDNFEPDFKAFKERLAKLQAAPRYTVCIAMTGWKTLTPAPKMEPSAP